MWGGDILGEGGGEEGWNNRKGGIYLFMYKLSIPTVSTEKSSDCQIIL